MKFSSNKIIKLAACIIVCEFAGILGSVFTSPSIGKWYTTLQKPFFNPPNWIFAPVWTLIFLMMGIAFYIVWEKGWQVKNKILVYPKFLSNFSGKKKTISIFFIQLFLNVFWSFLFFGWHNIGFAFIELLILWVAILLTIVSFYRISKKAAYLLYPYLAWVTFAGVLNFSLWVIN